MLFITISVVNDGCVSVCAMAHDRGQLGGVDSLFSFLGGFQGLNVDGQACVASVFTHRTISLAPKYYFKMSVGEEEEIT